MWFSVALGAVGVILMTLGFFAPTMISFIS
jgi:hypothetical protein